MCTTFSLFFPRTEPALTRRGTSVSTPVLLLFALYERVKLDDCDFVIIAKIVIRLQLGRIWNSGCNSGRSLEPVGFCNRSNRDWIDPRDTHVPPPVLACVYNPTLRQQSTGTNSLGVATSWPACARVKKSGSLCAQGCCFRKIDAIGGGVDAFRPPKHKFF